METEKNSLYILADMVIDDLAIAERGFAVGKLKKVIREKEIDADTILAYYQANRDSLLSHVDAIGLRAEYQRALGLVLSDICKLATGAGPELPVDKNGVMYRHIAGLCHVDDPAQVPQIVGAVFGELGARMAMSRFRELYTKNYSRYVNEVRLLSGAVAVEYIANDIAILDNGHGYWILRDAADLANIFSKFWAAGADQLPAVTEWFAAHPDVDIDDVLAIYPEHSREIWDTIYRSNKYADGATAMALDLIKEEMKNDKTEPQA